MPAWRVDGMDLAAVHAVSKLAVEHMRAGKGPTLIEAMVYRYTHHSGGIPGSAFGYRVKEEEAQWRSRDPVERCARELIERGWLTSEDDQALRAHCAAAMKAVLERLTEADPQDRDKRRIPPALWPDTTFRDHGLRGDLSEFKGARFEEAETATGKLGDMKFIDAVSQVMGRRMETDERIFSLGEDIHRMNGGANGATRGLAARFPDRIIGTPIAENGFTGLAGGVAMEGSYRPVVELMYSDFALVAADQLFNQIGKSRHMFGGDSKMPLVLRTKCAAGTGYGSQHSMDPAGLFSQWPGWRIVAPSTPFDYVGLMNSALRCEDPVLVLEHVDLYGTTGTGPLEDLDYCIPLGKAKVLREGRAFTVLTYSSMTRAGPAGGRGTGPGRRDRRPAFAGPRRHRLAADRGERAQDAQRGGPRAGHADGFLRRHAGRRAPAALLRRPGPAGAAHPRWRVVAVGQQGARTRLACRPGRGAGRLPANDVRDRASPLMEPQRQSKRGPHGH